MVVKKTQLHVWPCDPFIYEVLNEILKPHLFFFCFFSTRNNASHLWFVIFPPFHFMLKIT